ncbi:MAG: DNA polymerase Y family protein [Chloroflexota bacterium]
MRVACLFIPDFSIALARRDNPALTQRAIVVGGSPEEHARVTACSPEAAKTGVTAGMQLRRALALCPKAVFLPLQETQLSAEAAHITDLLALYSPVVEAIAPGHVHFDAHGLAQLAGLAEMAYLRDLHESVCASSGLEVRLGAAETVFAAHAAALLGEAAVTLIGGDKTREFLARLPVEALPTPPLMHQRLRLFGLEWLAQVRALGLSALQAQFGREGVRAWELASGRDDTRITPRREEVRISDELDLPAPTALGEPLVAGTRALLQRALGRPDLRGQSVRRLDWRLTLENGEQVSRRFVFREPTNDPVRMLFVVRQRIEALQLTAPAVSLALTLSGLCSKYGHQSNLWPIGPRRQRELLEAIDQLNTREGGPQVFRVVEVQPWSRIPERQQALVAYGP